MLKQSLEIVIPAYNEEKNIEEVIKKSLEFLRKNSKDYRVLVVDDGSTDKTSEILKNLEKNNKNIKVLFHEKNLGIGMAWKTLYDNCEKDIILTCPADLQFHPDDFSSALDFIKDNDAVSIYRIKKEEYTFFRNLLSNLNRKIIKFLFNLEVRDINWVKVYKKEIFKDLDLKLKSSLIETEIFAKLKKRCGKIIEIGAPHYPRIHGKPKGASIKNIYLVAKDILKLYFVILKFK